MLILTLRPGQSVVVGGAVVQFVRPRGRRSAVLGFTAPRSVPVWREEVARRMGQYPPPGLGRGQSPGEGGGRAERS